MNLFCGVSETIIMKGGQLGTGQAWGVGGSHNNRRGKGMVKVWTALFESPLLILSLMTSCNHEGRWAATGSWAGWLAGCCCCCCCFTDCFIATSIDSSIH